GIDTCFRHVEEPTKLFPAASRAFLVDRCTPEFNGWLNSTLEASDHFFIPLDGKRYRKPNYAWDTSATRHLHQARWLTFRRSVQSRRLASQGAARQRSLLHFNRQLATHYANRLRWDVEELVVSQDLLPFLWREGHLG